MEVDEPRCRRKGLSQQFLSLLRNIDPASSSAGLWQVSTTIHAQRKEKRNALTDCQANREQLSFSGRFGGMKGHHSTDSPNACSKIFSNRPRKDVSGELENMSKLVGTHESSCDSPRRYAVPRCAPNPSNMTSPSAFRIRL